MNIDRFRVEPGSKVHLDDVDPRSTAGFDGDKLAGRARAAELTAQLAALQALLYADGRHRLLVVLQAPDAGGKDGAVRAVFEGVNPQGVGVTSFKKPSEEELAHDYLWRVHNQVPRAGNITIFNRSHYEDVLIVRVHGLVPEHRWRKRYDHIRAWEEMLHDEGTTILKFYLHVSSEEQRRRLQERIDDPRKAWKFRKADLDERARWPEYQRAYEDALAETSTHHAPWFIVPADRNWFRNLVIGETLVQTLQRLDLEYPPPEPGMAGLKVT
jgi:PPK2 family polyphosphate:nucleotide phosphotransferase